jgi:DNA mismatch repair protein MutS2
MDKYLQDIVRDKHYWEDKCQEIQQQEKKLEETVARYEKDLYEVNRQRKEIVKSARMEAQQILSEANAKIESTIREIKEAQAGKERTQSARRELAAYKATLHETKEEDEQITRKMEKLRERQEQKKQNKKTDTAKETFTGEIEKGDTVRIKGQTATGTVIELQNRQVTVAFGMIKSTVKPDRLEKISRNRLKKEASRSMFASVPTADSIYEKKLNFKQEIDIRGMRRDEAVQTATYFIDDAILTNVSSVRILHGKGNGILRQLIRNYLSTVPGVKCYRDEHVQFGGTGITVVELE